MVVSHIGAGGAGMVTAEQKRKLEVLKKKWKAVWNLPEIVQGYALFGIEKARRRVVGEIERRERA